MVVWCGGALPYPSLVVYRPASFSYMVDSHLFVLVVMGRASLSLSFSFPFLFPFPHMSSTFDGCQCGSPKAGMGGIQIL